MKFGLPENKKDNVTINKNGTVLITDIENVHCIALINAIHQKTHFGKRLFCNGYAPLSPEKQQLNPGKTQQGIESVPVPISPAAESPSPKPAESSETSCIPSLVVSTASPVTDRSLIFPSKDQLVRRHSLSLENRTPPPKSLASDILGLSPSLESSRLLMNRLRNLQDSLSDFKSCADSDYSGGLSMSSSNDSDDDLKEKKEVVHSVNDKKRFKRQKRKLAVTPTKDFFLKKPNLQNSPQTLTVADTESFSRNNS